MTSHLRAQTVARKSDRHGRGRVVPPGRSREAQRESWRWPGRSVVPSGAPGSSDRDPGSGARALLPARFPSALGRKSRTSR